MLQYDKLDHDETRYSLTSLAISATIACSLVLYKNIWPRGLLAGATIPIFHKLVQIDWGDSFESEVRDVSA